MNKKVLSLLVVAVLFGLAGLTFAQTALTNPLDGVTDFGTLLTNIAGMIGTLIGALGTIMIIVAAFLYLTSAGSPEKIGKAKTALIYAIIGIAIGISASVITDVILEMLESTPSTP